MADTNGVRLLIGTARGAFIYHADADRKDWTLTGPHLDGWEVYSLHGDAAAGRVFAGTSSYVYGPTLRVSDDLGSTWRQIESGPRYSKESGHRLKHIWQIVPSPHGPGSNNTLYAGVDEAGLFVSRDGGENWSEVEGLTRHPTRPHWSPGGGGLCLHTILPDPANPNRMWVAVSAAGAFRTDDGGETWQVCNKGLPSLATGEDPGQNVCHCVHKMLLDPAGSGTLFMQYHGGVFRSTDAGDSWARIESGLPGNFGFPMAATKSGRLFVVPLDSDERRHVPGGRLRVYRSADGGGAWQATGPGLPDEPHYVGVLRDAMTTDRLDPPGVYFGTTMGEVFCSRDDGESWTRLPGQLPRVTTVKTM